MESITICLKCVSRNFLYKFKSLEEYSYGWIPPPPLPTIPLYASIFDSARLPLIYTHEIIIFNYLPINVGDSFGIINIIYTCSLGRMAASAVMVL